MGIDFAWPAMRRPAGMPNSDGTGQRFLVQTGFEPIQLSLGPAPPDAPVHKGRHTGRIIPAVLEPLQRAHEKGYHGPIADDPDYATHVLLPFPIYVTRFLSLRRARAMIADARAEVRQGAQGPLFFRTGCFLTSINIDNDDCKAEGSPDAQLVIPLTVIRYR
jgi:hypothetical protein